MQLRLLNFPSLMQTMAAATQAASAQLLDLTVGSILRAILEANAGIALWLQWSIARVLATTRAGTSVAADLDSWMADFSVVRLPAVAASGAVTFSRLTPGLAATIPVGALVRTTDGTQTFAVTADNSHPAFTATPPGYALAGDADAITVPVQAMLAGAAGNAQAGAIGQLATALPGVDRVTNNAPMQAGRDAESDAALRLRFQTFMDTRARATAGAIGHAIAGIQQGLSHRIAENVDTAGNARAGSFVVVVDDGTGAPSAALLARVSDAIESVRPVGTLFAVRPPTVVSVDITVGLTVAADAVAAHVGPAVAAAIIRHAGTLPIGASLSRSRIAQLAHDADAAVLSVGTITLNGGTADIAPPATGVIKPGIVTVG